MLTLVDLINYGFAVTGLVVAVMGLFLTFSAVYMNRKSRIFFIWFFFVLISYVSADLTSQLSLYLLGGEYVILSKIALFAESLFSSLLLPMLTIYICQSSGQKAIIQSAMYISVFVHTVYTAILVYTQFTENIYYFTDENVYHRGEYYPVLLIPPAVMILINFIVLFRRFKKLSIKQRIAFLCYLLIPLACMLVQMNFYGLLLIVIGTSVSAMILFLFILSDSLHQYVKQREENLEAQAKILVLQMRPHFIYNTMTSIYYLCEQDPKKAMKTIDDFTNYLRKNFAAIAKVGTIPFSEELSHVRAYIEIEKTRFEGSLFVEYDTEYISFRLPPLTLQPLVENSVKYGVDPELEPLHIKVITREVNSGSEIIVSDTGPGFIEGQAGEDDGREPHIALNNIRERLAIMCNGTLTINPKEGGGTEVKIHIPNESAKH